MKVDSDVVDSIAQEVAEAFQVPAFIYSEWYVQWHLQVVERIALELCERYPDADTSVVRLLAWLHDYGKLFDIVASHAATQTHLPTLFAGRNFPRELAQQLLDAIAMIDRKQPEELAQATIEVRIVSSADALAHYESPLMMLHWLSHPGTSVTDALASHCGKMQRDTPKICLPEAHARFEILRPIFERIGGIVPGRYFSW